MGHRFLKLLGRVMTAENSVFAIPELLENILLHLPERDLLLAQRVNRCFRNVTTASVHLQRKLFLTADPKSKGGLATELKWNPLIDSFRPRDCPYQPFCGGRRLDGNANVVIRWMVPVVKLVCDSEK